MEEILGAFANEADPDLRRNFARVLADLGVKFHSEEMVDAVMADLREGSGDADCAASMLARFHGPEGVEKIGAYLADEDARVSCQRRTTVAQV